MQGAGGWALSRVVGVFKKGGPAAADNYRPISLLEAACKLLAAMFAARLSRALGGAGRGTQYGFRAGRSTTD
eukprot:3192359-Alexandrium_andersonii.AAC.1